MVTSVTRILGRRNVIFLFFFLFLFFPANGVNLASYFLRETEMWVSCLLTQREFKSLLTSADQGVRKNVLFMSSVLQRKTNHITTFSFFYTFVVDTHLALYAIKLLYIGSERKPN